MTVWELESRLSSSELSEWMAYEKITGPLGRRRQDIQAATVAMTIANANRGRGKKFKISDFLVPYDTLGRRKSPRELLEKIKGFNKSLGGEVRG